MSRVVFASLLAMGLLGCSQSSSPISANLSGSGDQPSAAIAETRRARQGALGGEPAERRTAPAPAVASEKQRSQQLASLDDRAPRGSYDKAPKGSLSDRDYTSTQLNPETARDIVNAYRKQNGLKPLKINASLTDAAKNHARDLAKWDRISHFGSDGSSPWDRVKRTGYGAKLAAENVGTGQITFEEVMKGWKDSPGHNKNLLLADAEHMGIALVHEPKTEFKTFWTLVIGSAL